MNETTIYESEVFGKRFAIYGTKQNPLFLAKDVAEWIEHSNTTEMIRGVDDDEKLNSTILSSGQFREMLFLTENGLYEVLFQSRKPIAKEFKRQVKAVLKSIRQSGGYISGQETATDEELISRALIVAKNIIERKDKLISAMTPKAEFYDQIVDSKDAIDMRSAAAVLNIPNMGRNNLFAKLRQLGILDSENCPYRRYQDAGLFRVIETKFTDAFGDTHITKKTLVYQKGLDYIRKAVTK
mgnify:CR=1 FL=1